MNTMHSDSIRSKRDPLRRLGSGQSEGVKAVNSPTE
jgi:hypothetical protein